MLDACAFETVAAIDGLVVARQEGHLIFLAAFGAGNHMHLARSAISPIGGHGLFAALAAVWTAAGFVE